jgi:hypothetical protein
LKHVHQNITDTKDFQVKKNRISIAIDAEDEISIRFLAKMYEQQKKSNFKRQEWLRNVIRVGFLELEKQQKTLSSQ